MNNQLYTKQEESEYHGTVKKARNLADAELRLIIKILDSTEGLSMTEFTSLSEKLMRLGDLDEKAH